MILCFCFVIIGMTFWLFCCKWVWIIVMGSVPVLVSLCSHGGERASLSAFWIELSRANFSPGFGSYCKLLLSCGAGFGIRQGDKRPCIIPPELSAATVLPE